jgi:hypothetical protein
MNSLHLMVGMCQMLIITQFGDLFPYTIFLPVPIPNSAVGIAIGWTTEGSEFESH